MQVMREGVAVHTRKLDPDQDILGDDASRGAEDELLCLLEPLTCDREEERPGVYPAAGAYNKAVLELPCIDTNDGACGERAGAALRFAHGGAFTRSSFGVEFGHGLSFG